jgi:DNA-binding SARP family transcriptional activator
MREQDQFVMVVALNPPPTFMSARLQLLGGARILDEEGIPLQGRAAHRRRLAVLAVLGAARGRAVPRERLVALLWPDSPTSDARHSLVESLSVIRRELGVDPFVCIGDEVALVTELLACDTDELERALAQGDAERAAALYAGPFLDGFVVHDAPEFERWVEEERSRLAGVLAKGLEAYATRREAEEGPGSACDVWRQLYALDPFLTSVALRLGAALEAVGDPGAALRHLQAHASLLRAELDLSPPPDLVSAIERLRVAPPPPEDAVRNAAVSPPREPFTTVWVAQWVGADVPADAGTILRRLARRAALRAGGTVEGWVGDAVRARFDGPASAVAAAVALLRAWEGRRSATEVGALAIGLGHGPLEAEALEESDVATLRASVALTLARPGTAALPAAVARQAGRIPGVDTYGAGMSVLPGSPDPQEMAWLAPVQRQARAPAADNSAAHPASAPMRPRRRAGIAVAGGGIVVALLLLARAFLPSPPPAAPGRETFRLAILGCRPGNDSLTSRCEGLMDLVAAGLAGVRGIEVVRPPSGPDGRPFWSADALQKGALPATPGLRTVQGRLDHGDGRLRQVLFLTDPADGGRILAADTMYVPEAEAASLAERLSGRIARLLRRELGREIDIGIASGTRSAGAHDLFLRARVLRYGAQDSLGTGDRVRVQLGLADLAMADTLLSRAEVADPRWMEPAVERALVALLVGEASPPETREASYRAAVAHASHAVRLAPTSAAAHEMHGRALWELTALAAFADSGSTLIRQADAELVEALRLQEERATTLYLLSEIRYYRGDFAGSYALAVRGYRADPYLRGRMALARRYFRALLSMGEYERAAVVCRQSAEDFPDDLRTVECPLVLVARGYGRADPAVADSIRLSLLRRAGPGGPNGLEYQPFYWNTQYAAVLARAGRAQEARTVLEGVRTAIRAEMERVRREGGDGKDLWMSFLFDEAQVRVQLGETVAARRALDELSAQRPYYRDYVRSDQLFRGLF